MELTELLAQVMGVALVVMGLSGLLHGERMRRAMEEVSKSYLFPYFDGAFALIVGLLIVLTHNVWDDLLSSIVSAVGWLAVLEGVLMWLLPHDSLRSLMKGFCTPRAVMVWSVVTLVVGLYLTYAGFFA